MNLKEKLKLDRIDDLKSTYQTTKRLLGMLWVFDKKLFLGALIAAIIPAIIPFINAYIYKLIIDLIVGSVSGIPIDYNSLALLLGSRILTLFIQGTAFSYQSYIDLMLWTKFPVYLYNMVLNKLSNLDIQYFEDSNFKDKLEKVASSYAWRPINMISYAFFCIESLIQLSIALIAIVTLNWLLIFIALLVAIPSFLNEITFAKISWGIWSENSPLRKKFNYLSELIQGGTSVKEIKMFQTASKFLRDMSEIYQKFVIENSKIAKERFRKKVGISLWEILLFSGVEIYIVFSAIAKKITIGSISYYTTIIQNFHDGMNGFFRNLSNLFEQGQYVKEIFEVIGLEPKIKYNSNPFLVDFTRAPTIEFREVTFAYPGTKINILDNFSIKIKPGQKVAFVGENGAGKTTIIKLLARFYDVDKGEILINDVNLKDLDLVSWYKTMGILFQDYIRYEYSLKDNIYFGKVYEPENLKEIYEAARLGGADTVADRLPKGYEQMLGRTFEGGIDLSAGQWQKVALSRAFLRNAPVQILDEPTAAIDAKAENEIFEKVEKLAIDKTVIIISHRFSTVRNADKIYVIEKGKIIESGSHTTLMKNKGTYSTLFSLQAKGYK